MKYHAVVPDTNLPSYTENDLLTFVIPIAPNEELEQQSIYISGTLTTTKNSGPAVPLASADLVTYDAQAGIHGFFRSVIVSVNGGNGENVVENISNYNRYAKMFYEANQHYITQGLTNSSTMELRCGLDSYTKYVLPGSLDDDYTTANGDNFFSFMPLVSVNRTMNNISGEKVSQIKIQFTLEALSGCLSNPTPVANLAYSLKDLRCHYNVQPLSGSGKLPLQFLKVITSKTAIQSSEVNLTYQPPANVISLSCTFNKKGNIKQLMTDLLPNVQRVEFMVSGADYLLKFPLKSEEEIIYNYIKSLNNNLIESNAIYANLLGYGYGIGLNFGSPVDMRNSRMSINIQSNIGPSDLYNMFTFFTCVDAF
jgi:hypothetical protein